jgi:SAM-dependent MidA family methyltransferase
MSGIIRQARRPQEIVNSSRIAHHRPVLSIAPVAHLPAPDDAARAASARLGALIRADIEARGGWMPFDAYMQLALYAPGLGYYSAGSRKFGAAGDFVTAPELSPLFGRCLARQVAEVLAQDVPDVLEIGAGTGALPVVLLTELAALGRLPERYLILEVSADLRERQRETLAARAPRLIDRVQWLDRLPSQLAAAIIGNEVLDAIPTHVVHTRSGAIEELGVAIVEDGFGWAARAAQGEVLEAAAALALPDDYRTEITLAAPAFVHTCGRLLKRGALFFIDYGFPAHELYHPQRNEGTLMCHYRHHAHSDPFMLVGLQDITAHVDFTAVAHAGAAAGLELLGYASQAQFLVNCGITELLAQVPASDAAAYAPLAGAAQQLLSPSEMGELFKVIALGRGIAPPLAGFVSGDRSHRL